MPGKNQTTIKLEHLLGFELTDIAESPPEMERKDLADTASLIEQYTVPKPSPVETKKLIGAVRVHAAVPKLPRFRTALASARSSSPRLLEMISPQVRILGTPFWVVSALIVLLGVALTSQTPQAEMVPLLVLAPLVAAIGVAYAFRSIDERVMEVELTCAMSWQQLSLARLSIILGYDIFLLLAASLVTVRFLPQSGMPQLVISWLAPLLLWAGISLFISLRFGYYAGVIASFAAWGAQVLISMTFPEFNLWSIVATPIGLTTRVGLILLALGLLVNTFSQLARSGAWRTPHLESE